MLTGIIIVNGRALWEILYTKSFPCYYSWNLLKWDEIGIELFPGGYIYAKTGSYQIG